MPRIEGKILSRNVNIFLTKLQRKAADLQPILRIIAGDLLSDVDDNFETESANGKKWKKLSPRRIAEREALGLVPIKILQATRALATNITSQIKPNSIIIGTNTPYAADHQFGNAKEKIPARPFLTISNARIKEAEKKLSDYLLDV